MEAMKGSAMLWIDCDVAFERHQAVARWRLERHRESRGASSGRAGGVDSGHFRLPLMNHATKPTARMAARIGTHMPPSPPIQPMPHMPPFIIFSYSGGKERSATNLAGHDEERLQSVPSDPSYADTLRRSVRQRTHAICGCRSTSNRARREWGRCDQAAEPSIKRQHRTACPHLR